MSRVMSWTFPLSQTCLREGNPPRHSPGIHYSTGCVFDMKSITEAAHAKVSICWLAIRCTSQCDFLLIESNWFSYISVQSQHKQMFRPDTCIYWVCGARQFFVQWIIIKVVHMGTLIKVCVRAKYHLVNRLLVMYRSQAVLFLLITIFSIAVTTGNSSIGHCCASLSKFRCCRNVFKCARFWMFLFAHF